MSVVAVEFRNPNRRRAAVAVGVYGLVLTAVLAAVGLPLIAAIVAIVAAVLAWRNLRSGLFVTERSVIARNLGLGWRMPLAHVAEVSLMSTATDVARKTNVWVISEDGSCHQVTSLHGNPLRGEALVARIRDAIADAKAHPSRAFPR